MKFSLSSSQQKELLIRGKPLLIALPMQRDCETDEAATELAREWLLLPDGCWIVSARVQEIEVAPPDRPEWKTLTDLLGAIQRDQSESRAALITRHVVIVALVRPKQERHPLGVPQWANGPLRGATV